MAASRKQLWVLIGAAWMGWSLLLEASIFAAPVEGSSQSGCAAMLAPVGASSFAAGDALAGAWVELIEKDRKISAAENQWLEMLQGSGLDPAEWVNAAFHPGDSLFDSSIREVLSELAIIASVLGEIGRAHV